MCGTEELLKYTCSKDHMIVFLYNAVLVYRYICSWIILQKGLKVVTQNKDPLLCDISYATTSC